MSAALPIVAAPYTAGASLLKYPIDEANRQKKAANAEINRQRDEARRQEDEFRLKGIGESKRKAGLASVLQSSMLRSFLGRSNRGGTLLTGPLGLMGGQNNQPKTLLGT